jgi:DNA-binding winged helix-turn-helix (wHTH) protein
MPAPEPVTFGHWSLLPSVGDLSYGGRKVARIGRSEERILLLLLDRYPGALKVPDICERGGFKREHTVHTHVRLLRNKTCPEFIDRVGYGRGYRVNPEATPHG